MRSCNALMSFPKSLFLNRKRRIDLLPLINPPPSSRWCGEVRLRAPPGGMSARSRAALGMPWEIMGVYNYFRIYPLNGFLNRRLRPENPNNNWPEFAQIVHETVTDTRYSVVKSDQISAHEFPILFTHKLIHSLCSPLVPHLPPKMQEIYR